MRLAALLLRNHQLQRHRGRGGGDHARLDGGVDVAQAGDFEGVGRAHGVLWRERTRFQTCSLFHPCSILDGQASAFIRSRICARGDCGCRPTRPDHGDSLHECFEAKRINQEACAPDGACTNWTEESFSRLRRAEVGIHHHIAGAHLLRSAQESSWREDNRRVSHGDQVDRVAEFGRASPANHHPAIAGKEAAPAGGWGRWGRWGSLC